MSIYAQTGEKGRQIQIATNRGWSGFIDWTETIEDAPALQKLCDDGITGEAPAVLEELKRSLKKDAPSADIVAIGSSLAKGLKAAGKDEPLLITNGIEYE